MEATSMQSNAARGFGGLRVVTFESRLAAEATRLIEKSGGLALSAPSMREVPLDRNPHALAFATDLLAGRFGAVVFLTGVGTTYLFQAMETERSRTDLVAALGRTVVVARGPKPVRVLRELGVPIAVTVPEPNTWRELIIAMEESPDGIALPGARVAVQEYGQSNEQLLAALAERGARVTAVPVYRWALPEDRRPLSEAIRRICDRSIDVALFTSATQVRHLLEHARQEGTEPRLRESLREVCVCSIGPICTEALVEAGLGADLEPSHSKLGILVREAAERSLDVLTRKRAEARAQPQHLRVASDAPTPIAADFRRDTVHESVPPRADAVHAGVVDAPGGPLHAGVSRAAGADAVHRDVQDARACRRSGRHRRAPPQHRRRHSLLRHPSHSRADGPRPRVRRGEGPTIGRVVRSHADVDRLRRIDVRQEMAFVFDAVRLTRRELPPTVPLIGFSGAPFTLASYAIEGGSSRNFAATKTLMYTDKGAWDALLSLLADAVARYLNAQIEAGCQAVQLFDSWVGCLSPDDYERYVLPHTQKIFDALPAGVPSIHFGTDTATLLELQLRAGGSVLGIDHRTPLGETLERFDGQAAVQGNLDPAVLLADRAFVRAECSRILERSATARDTSSTSAMASCLRRL
jgi:uroporphyrinogen-III synthase